MHETLSGLTKIRQYFLSGFLLIVLCSGPQWAFAQAVSVSGRIVSSEDNGPVPGVNVIIKGTTTGTVTDADGRYSISAPSGDAVLVFSAIGFATQEIPVGTRSNIDVTLQLDVKTLSEVVVVGYGTQEKREVTGSIASVNGDALVKIANANPLEGMKGQIAGVDVLQTSGRPGANSSILIRGRRSINASNDPLFVIDGVPVGSGTSTATDAELAGRSPSLPGGTAQSSGSNPLNDFNPSDIASVEVLKDAAATAIYGSRGANGVVLITTKRGRTGKTTINYNGYYGVTQPFSTFPMMNGQQFANLKREAFRVGGPTNTAGRAAWNGTIPSDAAIFTDELPQVQSGSSTDWQKLVFKNGAQVNHQLSVNGGNEKTQFNVAMGYFKQDGTITGMDFEKITGRINIDHQINKRFKIGMSNQITHSVQNNGSDAVMSEAVNQTPLGLPRDANGNIIFLPIGDAIRSNPLSELVDGKKIDRETVNRLFSSAYLEAEIIPGLKYKLLVGTDLRFSDRGIFSGRFTNSQKNGDPAAQYQNQSNTGYTIENLITYTKTINGKHQIGANLLQSVQANTYNNHYTSVTGIPVEAKLWYDLSSAATINSVRSRYEYWNLASFMGRVNYAYNGKYMFQATLRADGSSRFGPSRKWAAFPGLSAGWRIKDEAFMSNVEVISDLKLRASYGVVGNTSIDPYKTQGVLTKTVYSWDEANAAGFGLSEIPNPNLTWEQSGTVDVGIDFGLFNGRLSGTFDVYQTNTEKLLLRQNLPASSGYNQIFNNIGSTRTNGLELTLSGNIIASPGGFKWDADFNIAHYKEQITDLAQRDANGNKTDDTGNAWFIGQPIRVFYDYKKVGIWQANEAGDATALMQAFPGEIKLQDKNGDGQITPADRQILGTDIPSVYGGLNNRFSWKGIDLSFFLYYRLGFMLDSRFSADQATMQGRYNNLAVDYWTIDNPTNSYPRPNRVQEFPQYNTVLRYQDGGFVKLRTITLGYSLPNSILSKYGISSLRVYVSGQNLYAWSNYTLFDPEAAPPSSPGGAQIGSGSIPSNKVFLGGINLTF